MTLLRQVIGTGQLIKNSITQHQAIAEAILAGDQDAAYAAMQKHLWYSAHIMLERVELKMAGASRNGLQAPG
ncbi:FCD domain-containing protein [Pollutimonas bauzanensis]|uniref:FCD domain-containing protein n=1 Tax=Pollutimonas bauzanensis TaxID=658167 RepID=A0A1M5X9V5_9BURK|nr:FCD domain-containing protein [Pollutimonas bauzanensis]SHH96571.1 FCD domain-containing protein [Pollutimonas bauzanensis]